MSALAVSQLEERLAVSVSLEKLRIGLREALAHGDCLRRKVDPRIDAFVAWVAAQPVPLADGTRNSACLDGLRARALILTLYCSGLRREEVTALETAEVLGGAVPGEADVRGKGDRERTVFLDAAALDGIRAYVNARGPTRGAWSSSRMATNVGAMTAQSVVGLEHCESQQSRSSASPSNQRRRR
jgi:hypothetical protein